MQGVAGHSHGAGAVLEEPGESVATVPAAGKRAAIRGASLADRAEVAMLAALESGDVHLVEMPVTHTFPPGLYVRQITIPKGTLVTSREHLHRHSFILTQGDILVTSDTEGQVRYVAPFAGITEPGTRRTLYANETTIWTTLHANPENITDPDVLAQQLTVHDNPLVDASCPLLRAWSKDYSPSAALAAAITPTISQEHT